MKTALATAAILALAAGTAIAADTNTKSSIADLGMVFEKARKVNAVERTETLNDLDARVNELIGDLDGKDKAAAYFLCGEIRFANGRYNEAAQAFKSSAKEAKDGPLAADANLGYIQSRQAAGTASSDKEWSEWFKTYGRSSTASEALLARAWSAIRGDSVSLANSALKESRAHGAPFAATA